MIRYYFSPCIGDGSRNNNFRPAIDNFINAWRAVDGRPDPNQITGEMFVKADVDATQHTNIIGIAEYFDLQDLLPTQNIPPVALTQLNTRAIPFVGTSVEDGVNSARRRFLVRNYLGASDFIEPLASHLTPPRKAEIQSIIDVPVTGTVAEIITLIGQKLWQ